MKRIFDAANQYCQESDWKTIVALKFCLLSLGIIIGLLLPQAYKGMIIALCAIVFIFTYIPLMLKLYRIWKNT